MKNYLAEADFYKYQDMGRDLTGHRQGLLYSLIWHAEQAKAHLETPADTERMQNMVADLAKTEQQLLAIMQKINEAANLAGFSVLTRTHLNLPNAVKP